MVSVCQDTTIFKISHNLRVYIPTHNQHISIKNIQSTPTTQLATNSL